jgi:hypothetical protein
MDFGYQAEDAAAAFGIKTELGLGSSFSIDRANAPAPALISDDIIYRRFVELVERSPEWGWRAGKTLGIEAFTTPVERPLPMPAKGITSIEVAFGDRGPRKVVRERQDRIGARFDATIQVCTVESRGVSKPVFKGRVDFYPPARALAKARELTKPTKTKTPFTPAYVELVEQIVAGLAEPDGLLIGFIHTKPPKKVGGGGTYYHDRQIMLASAKGLEDHALDEAIIILADDTAFTSFRLPRTDRRTSKGKALTGTLMMQSRGVVRAGYYSEAWETGIFQMQRQKAS